MSTHWHILIRNTIGPYLRQIEGTYLQKETALIVAKAIRSELNIPGDRTSVAECQRPMCRLTFRRNQVCEILEEPPVKQASFAEREAAFEEAGVPSFRRVVCPTCSAGIGFSCIYPSGIKRVSHVSREALYGAMKSLAEDRESV